jgi:hypothetical protein
MQGVVMHINMGSTFVLTAALMTYDIQKKYCHAVGRVIATQDQLQFTCQDLNAYFEGDQMLKLKRIETNKDVCMKYKTGKYNITITGPNAHFENRRVVFTVNPHVVIEDDSW